MMIIIIILTLLHAKQQFLCTFIMAMVITFHIVILKGHCDVNATEFEKGGTPLHFALDVMSFNFAMVEVLIRNGADPNIADKERSTPIEMAINFQKSVSLSPSDMSYPFLNEVCITYITILIFQCHV